MTPIEKVDKVVKILELVDANVRHAFKLRSYFCRAAYNDDVKKRFDKSQAASGYNQILDSLYFELIMTLARLFDNLQEDRSAHNTASIPEIMSLLSETEVVAEIQFRSEQRKTPTSELELDLKSSDLNFLKELKVAAKQSASKETSQIFGLLKDYEKLKGSHLLSRLRTLRNELLAHNAIEINKNNPACYGDAEEFLEKTSQFVVGLNSSIRSLNDDYKGVIGTWQEHANYFWENIVDKSIEKATSKTSGPQKPSR